jgi:hypothetical protein
LGRTAADRKITNELWSSMPVYLRSHGIPKTPRDLAEHRCIGSRGPAGPYRWHFQKGAKFLTVSVSGPLFTDDPGMIIHGAIAGVGLGPAFENQIAEYVAKQTPDLRTGRLRPAISRLLLVLPESPKPTCNIDRANQLPSTLLKFKGLSPFLRQAGASAITVRSTVERTHDVL